MLSVFAYATDSRGGWIVFLVKEEKCQVSCAQA